MAGELARLYEAKLSCKVQHPTFSGVDSCTHAALADLDSAIRSELQTNALLGCVDDDDWLMDISELGRVLGFDLEDVFNVQNMFCGLRDKRIDVITLSDGSQYLVKHSGVGTSPADILVWHEAEVISRVLGEDMPSVVYFNPVNGRIVTTWFQHETGRLDYRAYQPHEMVTTIIFETLLGDIDRNTGNAVTIRGAAFGHLDFTEVFSSRDQSRQPASKPAINLILDIENSPDQVNQEYPDFLTALREGRDRWSRVWRPALTAFPSMRSTNPKRLDTVSDVLEDLEGRLLGPEGGLKDPFQERERAGRDAGLRLSVDQWNIIDDRVDNEVFELARGDLVFRYYVGDKALEIRNGINGALISIENGIGDLHEANRVVEILVLS